MPKRQETYRKILERVRGLRPQQWEEDPLRRLFEERDRARLVRRGIDPDSEIGARHLLLREFRVRNPEVFTRFVLASEKLDARAAGLPWRKGEMLILS
jgi:hypothetical protein